MFNTNQEFSQERGIPQGACLAPYLFSLFINDISKSLTIPHILYADDLVLYLSNTSPNYLSLIQTNLDNLVAWCDRNDLKINEQKCKVMCFTKRKYDFRHKFKINNIELELVNSFKYLGIIFDSNMTFKNHFDSVRVKMDINLSRIRNIKRCLSDKAFVMLFNAYVLPIVDFCIEIWLVHPGTKVKILQNKIEKAFLEFFYCKKTRRKHSKLNNTKYILNIFKNFNIMTIEERQKLFTLNRVLRSYCNIEHCKEISSWFVFKKSRGTSRTPAIAHKTALFKKSFRYRSGLLWNSIRIFYHKAGQFGF